MSVTLRAVLGVERSRNAAGESADAGPSSAARIVQGSSYLPQPEQPLRPSYETLYLRAHDAQSRIKRNRAALEACSPTPTKLRLLQLLSALLVVSVVATNVAGSQPVGWVLQLALLIAPQKVFRVPSRWVGGCFHTAAETQDGSGGGKRAQERQQLPNEEESEEDRSARDRDGAGDGGRRRRRRELRLELLPWISGLDPPGTVYLARRTLALVVGVYYIVYALAAGLFQLVLASNTSVKAEWTERNAVWRSSSVVVPPWPVNGTAATNSSLASSWSYPAFELFGLWDATVDTPSFLWFLVPALWTGLLGCLVWRVTPPRYFFEFIESKQERATIPAHGLESHHASTPAQFVGDLAPLRSSHGLCLVRPVADVFGVSVSCALVLVAVSILPGIMHAVPAAFALMYLLTCCVAPSVASDAQPPALLMPLYGENGVRRSIFFPQWVFGPQSCRWTAVRVWLLRGLFGSCSVILVAMIVFQSPLFYGWNAVPQSRSTSGGSGGEGTVRWTLDTTQSAGQGLLWQSAGGRVPSSWYQRVGLYHLRSYLDATDYGVPTANFLSSPSSFLLNASSLDATVASDDSGLASVAARFVCQVALYVLCILWLPRAPASVYHVAVAQPPSPTRCQNVLRSVKRMCGKSRLFCSGNAAEQLLAEHGQSLELHPGGGGDSGKGDDDEGDDDLTSAVRVVYRLIAALADLFGGGQQQSASPPRNHNRTATNDARQQQQQRATTTFSARGSMDAAPTGSFADAVQQEDSSEQADPVVLELTVTAQSSSPLAADASAPRKLRGKAAASLASPQLDEATPDSNQVAPAPEPQQQPRPSSGAVASLVDRQLTVLQRLIEIFLGLLFELSAGLDMIQLAVCLSILPSIATLVLLLPLVVALLLLLPDTRHSLQSARLFAATAASCSLLTVAVLVYVSLGMPETALTLPSYNESTWAWYVVLGPPRWMTLSEYSLVLSCLFLATMLSVFAHLRIIDVELGDDLRQDVLVAEEAHAQRLRRLARATVGVMRDVAPDANASITEARSIRDLEVLHPVHRTVLLSTDSEPEAQRVHDALWRLSQVVFARTWIGTSEWALLMQLWREQEETEVQVTLRMLEAESRQHRLLRISDCNYTLSWDTVRFAILPKLPSVRWVLSVEELVLLVDLLDHLSAPPLWLLSAHWQERKLALDDVVLMVALFATGTGRYLRPERGVLRRHLPSWCRGVEEDHRRSDKSDDPDRAHASPSILPLSSTPQRNAALVRESEWAVDDDDMATQRLLENQEKVVSEEAERNDAFRLLRLLQGIYESEERHRALRNVSSSARASSGGVTQQPFVDNSSLFSLTSIQAVLAGWHEDCANQPPNNRGSSATGPDDARPYGDHDRHHHNRLSQWVNVVAWVLACSQEEMGGWQSELAHRLFMAQWRESRPSSSAVAAPVEVAALANSVRGGSNLVSRASPPPPLTTALSLDHEQERDAPVATESAEALSSPKLLIRRSRALLVAGGRFVLHVTFLIASIVWHTLGLSSWLTAFLLFWVASYRQSFSATHAALLLCSVAHVVCAAVGSAQVLHRLSLVSQGLVLVALVCTTVGTIFRYAFATFAQVDESLLRGNGVVAASKRFDDVFFNVGLSSVQGSLWELILYWVALYALQLQRRAYLVEAEKDALVAHLLHRRNEPVTKSPLQSHEVEPTAEPTAHEPYDPDAVVFSSNSARGGEDSGAIRRRPDPVTWAYLQQTVHWRTMSCSTFFVRAQFYAAVVTVAGIFLSLVGFTQPSFLSTVYLVMFLVVVVCGSVDRSALSRRYFLVLLVVSGLVSAIVVMGLGVLHIPAVYHAVFEAMKSNAAAFQARGFVGKYCGYARLQAENSSLTFELVASSGDVAATWAAPLADACLTELGVSLPTTDLPTGNLLVPYFFAITFCAVEFWVLTAFERRKQQQHLHQRRRADVGQVQADGATVPSETTTSSLPPTKEYAAAFRPGDISSLPKQKLLNSNTPPGSSWNHRSTTTNLAQSSALFALLHQFSLFLVFFTQHNIQKLLWVVNLYAVTSNVTLLTLPYLLFLLFDVTGVVPILYSATHIMALHCYNLSLFPEFWSSVGLRLVGLPKTTSQLHILTTTSSTSMAVVETGVFQHVPTHVLVLGPALVLGFHALQANTVSVAARSDEDGDDDDGSSSSSPVLAGQDRPSATVSASPPPPRATDQGRKLRRRSVFFDLLAAALDALRTAAVFAYSECFRSFAMEWLSLVMLIGISVNPLRAVQWVFLLVWLVCRVLLRDRLLRHTRALQVLQFVFALLLTGSILLGLPLPLAGTDPASAVADATLLSATYWAQVFFWPRSYLSAFYGADVTRYSYAAYLCAQPDSALYWSLGVSVMLIKLMRRDVAYHKRQRARFGGDPQGDEPGGDQERSSVSSVSYVLRSRRYLDLTDAMVALRRTLSLARTHLIPLTVLLRPTPVMVAAARTEDATTVSMRGGVSDPDAAHERGGITSSSCIQGTLRWLFGGSTPVDQSVAVQWDEELTRRERSLRENIPRHEWFRAPWSAHRHLALWGAQQAGLLYLPMWAVFADANSNESLLQFLLMGCALVLFMHRLLEHVYWRPMRVLPLVCHVYDAILALTAVTNVPSLARYMETYRQPFRALGLASRATTTTSGDALHFQYSDTAMVLSAWRVAAIWLCFLFERWMGDFSFLGLVAAVQDATIDNRERTALLRKAVHAQEEREMAEVQRRGNARAALLKHLREAIREEDRLLAGDEAGRCLDATRSPQEMKGEKGADEQRPSPNASMALSHKSDTEEYFLEQQRSARAVRLSRRINFALFAQTEPADHQHDQLQQHVTSTTDESTAAFPSTSRKSSFVERLCAAVDSWTWGIERLAAGKQTPAEVLDAQRPAQQRAPPSHRGWAGLLRSVTTLGEMRRDVLVMLLVSINFLESGCAVDALPLVALATVGLIYYPWPTREMVLGATKVHMAIIILKTLARLIAGQVQLSAETVRSLGTWVVRMPSEGASAVLAQGAITRSRGPDEALFDVALDILCLAGYWLYLRGGEQCGMLVAVTTEEVEDEEDEVDDDGESTTEVVDNNDTNATSAAQDGGGSRRLQRQRRRRLKASALDLSDATDSEDEALVRSAEATRLEELRKLDDEIRGYEDAIRIAAGKTAAAARREDEPQQGPGSPLTERPSGPEMVIASGVTASVFLEMIRDAARRRHQVLLGQHHSAREALQHAADVSAGAAAESAGEGGAIASWEQRLRSTASSVLQNVERKFGCGRDLYTVSICVEFVALIYTAFSYHSLAGLHGGFVQSIINNLLPGWLVLWLILLVFIMIGDRVTYVLSGSSYHNAQRLKYAGHVLLTLFYVAFYVSWTSLLATDSNAAVGGGLLSLKLVYLYLSAYQLRMGYPTFRRHDPMTSHPRWAALYHVYRAVPFMWELRQLIDWTCTRTALTFSQYLRVEDVHHAVYEVYCDLDDAPKKRGTVVPFRSKAFPGLGLFVLTLFALFFPMLYYSTFNPSVRSNLITDATISIEADRFGVLYEGSTISSTTQTLSQPMLQGLSLLYPRLVSESVIAPDVDLQLLSWSECSATRWTTTIPLRQALMDTLLAFAATNGSTTSAVQQPSLRIRVTLSSDRAIAGSSTTGTTAYLRALTPEESLQLAVSVNASIVALAGSGGLATPSFAGNGSGSTTALPNLILPFMINSGTEFKTFDTADAAATSTATSHDNPSAYHCALSLFLETSTTATNGSADFTGNSFWCVSCQPIFSNSNDVEVELSNASAPDRTCLSTQRLLPCAELQYDNWNSAAAMAKPLSTAPYLITASNRLPTESSLPINVGIVALYATFILSLANMLRDGLSGNATKAMLEEIRDPKHLADLLSALFLCRGGGDDIHLADTELEESLYFELVDLLRAPEQLRAVTGLRSRSYDSSGQRIEVAIPKGW